MKSKPSEQHLKDIEAANGPGKQFQKAVSDLKAQCVDFIDTASDPYKAPEQIAEAIRPLVHRAWEAEVQYAASLRK